MDCFTFWLVWNREESLSFLFAKVMERASLLPSPKCTSSRSHLTMWPNTRSSLTLSTWYKPSLKADILQRRRTGWDGVACTLIAAGGEVKWFGRFGIRWPADFVRSHLGLPTNEQSWKHWWEQKKVINQQIIFHETKEWQEAGSSSTLSHQNARKEVVLHGNFKEIINS